MDGDITRSTFDAVSGFTAVRQQQGRVQLDADWNEQVDIALHDLRAARVDVVGRAGAPLSDPGFEVVAVPPPAPGDASGLSVGAGRYYVDGLRVDAADPVLLSDLPVDDGATVAVLLDVWEQTVTAVEVPRLREVALGGPDTTVRTRLTHAVRALRVTAPANPDCDSVLPEWDALVAGSTGTLEVQLDAAAADPSLCLVPESAGYRGLENRTYRVEVHTPTVDPVTGALIAATPTMLWSRDNASTLASLIGAPNGLDLQVDRLGPGGADGFARGDLVMVTTDATDLAGTPGLLALVDDVLGGTTLRLRSADDATPAGAAALAADLTAVVAGGGHPKVRRWDGSAPVPLGTTDWIDLDAGLQVRLGTVGRLRTGDHWVIPARTAILPGTGDWHLEWPQPIGGVPVPVLPFGPEHHYVKLGIAVLEAGRWTVVSDCRDLFGPLVDDLQFTARSGDGQETRSGGWLPAPLVVGVSRGVTPAPHQSVSLTVASGGGALSLTAPDPAGVVPAGQDVSAVTTTTGADGLVRVWWRLGPAPAVPAPGDLYDPAAAQQVAAVLQSSGGTAVHEPVTFTAIARDELVLVDAGGDGQLGRPGETLELALRARVTSGSRPAAGQRVAFEVESRMLGGAALDELTGGSLHATLEVVEVTPWPGGLRTVRAVVRTDATGVAQVQWILGTEKKLTVQRVSATLLDQPSAAAQQIRFGAHLALASGVDWTPCAAFGKVDDQTVQGGLDILCRVVGGRGTVAGAVMKGPRPQIDLRPENTVPLGLWRGELVLRAPYVLTADPPAAAVQAALVVSADLPDAEFAGAYRSVLLPGSVELRRSERGFDLVWGGGPTVAGILKPQVAAGPVVLRVALLPSLLARDAPQVAFHAAVGLAP